MARCYDPTSVLFFALSHPVRRKILRALSEGDRLTPELVESHQEYAPVSHNLAALKAEGLAVDTREGITARWSLTDRGFRAVQVLDYYERDLGLGEDGEGERDGR